MRDEIRRLSDELARDPDSRAFARLGELLRVDGQLTVARQIIERGLHRHPYDAYAHGVLARILLDGGELDRALDEWDMVRRIAPNDPEPPKGMAFIAFQKGDRAAAIRLLEQAAALAPGDPEIMAALQRLRARRNGHGKKPPPNDGNGTLVIDASGLIIEGVFHGPDGVDRSAEIGANFAGVRTEAAKLLNHIGLGTWISIHVESLEATLALAPAPSDAIVLVSAPKSTPLGLVRQTLERERAKATARLSGP